MRDLCQTLAGLTCILNLCVLPLSAANILGSRDAPDATYIGVSTIPLSVALADQLELGAGNGLVVDSVDPRGPCNGLLERHDVIREIDGQMLFNRQQLTGILETYGAGQDVKLEILRKAKPLSVEVRPETRPANIAGHPYWSSQHRLRLPTSREDSSLPGAASPPRLDSQSIDEILRHIRQSHEDRMEIQAAETQNMDAFLGDIREKLESVKWTPPMSPKNYRHRRSRPLINTNTVYVESDVETLSIADEQMSASMMIGDNGTYMIVQDEQGNIVFEGPVNTREERMNIPGQAFKYMDHLEQLREDAGGPGTN